MGRPQLWRRVSFVPAVTYFKPAGIPLVNLQEVHLLVEEAEAIRLKDLEGLDQSECAAMMDISQPTFHRLVVCARRKIADALTHGKTIKIQGGNYRL